jgi:hypothetical protein
MFFAKIRRANVLSLSLLHQRIKCFSSTVHDFKDLQGGHFVIQSTLSNLNLNIETKWQENAQIDLANTSDSCEIDVDYDNVTQTLILLAKDAESHHNFESTENLSITVPEHCNLSIVAKSLNLSIKNKVC